ncbi:transglutaminase domain-containing protein [Microbacterium dauci]|uniref:Transglutaminase domain-containing protein n=1 Tax=Microbacterium dauci TaxID=3048008 RepID=A0ABT6ZAW9_9MICO|nr:transglutaminase domain-containing protein [Microbacterium sp. LX3-4]MDJ1113300.1 transglutaminase domain-containing protein [Microbacterium sp. LX3-4]
MNDSRRALRETRTARATADRWRFLLVQAALLNVLFAVGAVAAWPIYRSPVFLIAVGAGLVAAHAVAALGTRWRWSGWWTALAALGAYAVLGLPVAAPGSLVSVPTALRALVGILIAPATGWKDLLTLELPLGSYQTTLAPVLFLFIALPTAALSLAWRSRRWWWLAVPAALGLTVFGVVFGARGLSAPLRFAGFAVQIETLVGAAALVAALAVVIWRMRDDRRRALRQTAAASGVRTTGRATRGLAGRAAVAVAMVVASVAGAALWAPWALADRSRDVARAAVDPFLEVAQTLSPLAEYRASFGDDAYEATLFTVAAPEQVDRVRIATLPFYDGRTVRAVDPDAGLLDPTTAFTRVPSQIDTASATTTIEVGVGDLGGIWVPTVGQLHTIAFDGARASALADGFFHNAATGTAVELEGGGLEPGDAYRLEAVVEADATAVASLVPARSGPSLPTDLVPESLTEWIEAQGAPTGGAGLETLIDRLRARGYLSHALSADADADAAPVWMRDLGIEDFQPSRAGHSTDRIGVLFSELLARQREMGDASDAALVSGIGDDEQFAVAAMLIADQLGFESRVVVGTRLRGDDGLPACDDDGTCRGGDLAAWVEVQDAAGTWTAIDATPQSESFPSPDLEQRQDPENPTDVRRENAESVLPADASPSDGTERAEDTTEEQADLSGLWFALRVTGISLLGLVVLFGPLLVVLIAKAVRRRSRRRAAHVVDRFTGGWQEFVDTAVDHGYPVPQTQTRQELAALYAGEGARLATLADRSVFDATPPSDAENAEFWRIVDAERARFAGELGWWRRWRARASLRSLRRRDERRGRRKGRGRRG